jgi:outer membrane immunogenic protein
MRVTIGASAVALFAIATPSLAADIPVASSDWTGFYVGVEAGYGWGDVGDSLSCGFSDDNTVGSVSVIAGSGPASCNEGSDIVAITGLENEPGAPWDTVDDFSELDGWLAGAKLGYSHQFGSFVAGVELSGLVSGMTDDGATFIDGEILTEVDGFDGYYEASMSVDWLVTATAKLGYSITEDLLISAVGGLAFVKTSFESSAGYEDESTNTGWTAGASAEYRISDNVSLTADYRYISVEDIEYRGSSLIGFIDNRHEYDLDANIVTAGVNYRF